MQTRISALLNTEFSKCLNAIFCGFVLENSSVRACIGRLWLCPQLLRLPLGHSHPAANIAKIQITRALSCCAMEFKQTTPALVFLFFQQRLQKLDFILLFASSFDFLNLMHLRLCATGKKPSAHYSLSLPPHKCTPARKRIRFCSVHSVLHHT